MVAKELRMFMSTILRFFLVGVFFGHLFTNTVGPGFLLISAEETFVSMALVVVEDIDQPRCLLQSSLEV